MLFIRDDAFVKEQAELQKVKFITKKRKRFTFTYNFKFNKGIIYNETIRITFT
jgi:hypothetical protein